jgi:arylsulfatase A-like enzyme
VRLHLLIGLLLGCSQPKPAPLLPHQLSCAANPSGPDVLLLTIDTLRADRLGYAGHTAASTPSLDALAASGQAFLQATTPLPRTTPALASLLTGLRPHHHGAREVGDSITVDQTIATALQGAGWRTLALSAMKVASPDQGLGVGFDAFDVHHDVRAAELTAAALARVDQVPSDCPMMLWVHYADPHFPYLPPPDAPQPEGQPCRELGERAAAGKLRRYALFGDLGGKATRALPSCSELYDAEISATDAAVGQLLDGLSGRGRSPVVVFTADHGENLGEWGLFYEHGPNVHDASLRVPLIIAGPGVPVGRSEAVARIEDIVPTLGSLLHLPALGALPSDGQDLSARWLGTGAGPTLAFGESGSALHARLTDYLVTGRAHRLRCINGPRYSLCKTGKNRELLYDRSTDPLLKTNILSSQASEAERLRSAWTHWPVERTRQRVVRTERFSMVARPQLSGGYATTLYDHRADPALSTDVSAQHPELARSLGAALKDWGEELDGTSGGTEARSEETEAAMRSLGYLE